MSEAGNGLPAGVTARTVETPRLATHLLKSGPEGGGPVVFVHGNVSSSLFFDDTLAALPYRYRGLAPDLRGFGGSGTKPLDATRACVTSPTTCGRLLSRKSNFKVRQSAGGTKDVS